MGISANTNINGTTVQAELTYRPDFPLATNGGDQGQQISDAAGTTTLLSVAVGQTYNGGCVAAGAAASEDVVTVADMLALTDATATAKCGPKLASVLAYRAGTGDSGGGPAAGGAPGSALVAQTAASFGPQVA